LSQSISESLQACIVMSGDQCRLEHQVPLGTAAACNNPFLAKGCHQASDAVDHVRSCLLGARQMPLR